MKKGEKTPDILPPWHEPSLRSRRPSLPPLLYRQVQPLVDKGLGQLLIPHQRAAVQGPAGFLPAPPEASLSLLEPLSLCPDPERQLKLGFRPITFPVVICHPQRGELAARTTTYGDLRSSVTTEASSANCCHLPPEVSVPSMRHIRQRLHKYPRTWKPSSLHEGPDKDSLLVPQLESLRSALAPRLPSSGM